ncbi:hypothetical protein ACC862_03470 [Rhizobium ruizarguesonis]
MADVETLLDEVRMVFPATVSPSLTSDSKGGDVFEAFVWKLVVDAAEAEGAEITLQNRDGTTVDEQFFFRTSPGHISSDRHPYSHAVLQFDRCPALEAHVGIYVSGKSMVQHECDVSVLYRDEAELCRRHGADPRNSQVILAVECKYYVETTMGVNLARSFLGLSTDIMHKNRFFVGVSEGETVERLLAHHHKRYETGVSPVDARARHLRLRGDFEKVFRDFKRLHARR